MDENEKERDVLPVKAKPPGAFWVGVGRPSQFLFALLAAESILCSLFFSMIAYKSQPPPAPSGTAVMWIVGVFLFQVTVVPVVLISFQVSIVRRMILSSSIILASILAVVIGFWIEPSGFGYQAQSFELVVIKLSPVGCLIAGIPIAISTYFFRRRLTNQGAHSQAGRLTIGKMMALTAIVAAFAAYSRAVLSSGVSSGVASSRVFELTVITVVMLVAGLISLLAMFGLRENRNCYLYWTIIYGVPFVIAWGGVAWVSVAWVSTWMPYLWQGAMYLSISVISLIAHWIFLAVALKLAGFEYRVVNRTKMMMNARE